MKLHEYIKLVTEDNKYPRYVRISVTCDLKPVMKDDHMYDHIMSKMSSGKAITEFIDRARPKIKFAIEEHFEQANKLTNWLADTENLSTEKDIRNGKYVFNIYANIKSSKIETRLLDYVRKISSEFEVTDTHEF